MKLLVTGGAGFIGSNFVHQAIAKHPDWKLVVLDKLTYAGNLKNLEPELGEGRCEFVQMDICDRGVLEQVRGCDAVIHFAAESHVDRSIEDASAFVKTNVEGTHNMLQAAAAAGVPRFVHVSTDEVYGSLGDEGLFTEQTPIQPNSPYSATKAASDLLVLAYVHTHKFPGIVTRCSNNYGPYQFPEKFIPLMIANGMAGQKVPVYGKGANVRDWIHVDDHCSALLRGAGKGPRRRGLQRRRRLRDAEHRGGEADPEGAGQGRRVDPVRHRPAGPRSALRYRLHQAGARTGMDAAGAHSIRAWPRPSSGIATIRHWLDDVRSGQYRDYYQRHYTQREKTFAG